MSDTSGPHIYIAFHDSSVENDFVRRLAFDVEQAGAPAFALPDNDAAPAAVGAMLDDTSANRSLIVIVTPESVASSRLQDIVNLALQGAIEPAINHIIALVATPTPEESLPQAWRALPRLDANGDYAGAVAALFATLGLPAPSEETFKAHTDDDWDESAVLSRRSASGMTSADEGDEGDDSDGAAYPEQPPTVPDLRGLPDQSAGFAEPYNEPPPPTLDTPTIPLEPPSPPVAQPASPSRPAAPASPSAPSAPWPSAPYGAATSPVGEYDSMPQTLPSGLSGPLQTVTALERVSFSSYYQKEMAPNTPTPLLVYLALDDAAAQSKVAAQAAERLAGRLDKFRAGTSDDRVAMIRGTKLRIIPTIPGFRVNPQWMDVTWEDDAQQHEFTVRADTAPEDRSANGYVRIYQGLTLRAEIPLSIYVTRGVGAARTPEDFARAIARAYRKVFASYSHADTPIVASCEAAAQALGDRYLRDVITLQSGQQWNQRLMQMIVEADIFQLFWSRNAANSAAVREEWQYALTMNNIRPGFVRPVYWSPTPYAIPRQLEPFHFEPIDLSAIGWGPIRRFFYNMQVG